MKTNTQRTVKMAIGRIFRIASRPYKPGDDAEYARCRGIVMELAPSLLTIPKDYDYSSWKMCRDGGIVMIESRGAQGDY
jgi:hypothetical protein